MEEERNPGTGDSGDEDRHNPGIGDTERASSVVETSCSLITEEGDASLVRLLLVLMTILSKPAR